MSKEYEKNSADVLFKCGRHCCICRRFRPTMLQVHHIIERQDGGTDEIDNLMAVCLTCHSDAHTTGPFARRFTADELKQHRNRVYEMVRNGTLVPPNDDAIPAMPADLASESRHVDETFVITANQGLIQPQLPKEAIEILIAAAHSQDAEVITVDTFSGNTVQVGGENLIPSQSTRDKARFKSAVEELVKHGLLAGNTQVLRVTHKGFLLADELEAVMRQS